MEKVQGQSIFQRTAYKTRQNTRARFLTHACVLSRSMCVIPLDHHLTTPFSQPVPCIVFYVPTFFYNHHKQRRKLCTLHNFRRCIMLFACTSQFSDPEGRWFESSRAHQTGRLKRYRGQNLSVFKPSEARRLENLRASFFRYLSAQPSLR